MTTMELRSAADRLIELHEAGDLDGVLSLADELATRAVTFEPSDEVVRESLFIARFQRAMALTERGELQAAAQAYADAASTPTDLADPDQRHEVAMALLHEGMCLDALGEPDAAIGVYEQVVDRFGDADDAVTRDQVVRAQVNLGAAYVTAEDAQRSLATVQPLIDTLDPAVPLDAEQWVMARRIAGAALQQLGRPVEALSVLEGVQSVDIDDPGVREQQAQAHTDRAELLEELGDDGLAAEARQAAEAIRR